MVGVDASIVGEFMSHTSEVCADYVKFKHYVRRIWVSQKRCSRTTQQKKENPFGFSSMVGVDAGILGELVSLRNPVCDSWGFLETPIKNHSFLSGFYGGAEATTLELIIDKFIEKIRTPEIFEIVRMIDFINSKKVA